jgi:hypothetical protein
VFFMKIPVLRMSKKLKIGDVIVLGVKVYMMNIVTFKDWANESLIDKAMNKKFRNMNIVLMIIWKPIFS